MDAESGLESPGLTEQDDVVVTPDSAVPTPPAEPAPAPLRARLAALERELREDPHSFGFFQAVRLLERLHPGKARVGGFDDPAREVVRFAVPPRLGFPASEIQHLEVDGDAGPASMRVNFMGLTGPQGVLPYVYTLLGQERLRQRDAALVDFLDLFHHRLLSLFYQAWRKYRFTVAREDGADDRLADHLLDLIGLGLDATRGRLPIPDEALLSRAGLLLPQPRGAASAQQLLEDYFQVPIALEQFIGGWFTVPPGDRCAIDDDAVGPANRLGSAVVGDELWDAQARVRVRIGPLSRARYDEFLPGGVGHHELAALLRFFSHDQFEFEVQLVLAGDDVPGVCPGDEHEPPRLGWSTWIRTAPRLRDADETILTLHHGAPS